MVKKINKKTATGMKKKKHEEGVDFRQVFKRLDNIMRADDDCSTALDYVEQKSWILFLKYLHDREIEDEEKAKLDGKKYRRILRKEYQWEAWAVPRKKDGSVDYNQEKTGEELITFVEGELFPYLKSLKNKTNESEKLKNKIGEIFEGINNKVKNGYHLRNAINEVENLRFNTQKDKHEISDLYEDGLAQMGNAGRNGGEYYTPRPLIKAIVKIVNPTVGEVVYDGAVGSAGFLVEAFEHMRKKKDLTSKELEILKTKTFYGKEKKPLSFINAIMNMILHGIDIPNIERGNTLEEKVADYQEKDRVDMVLANPPFGSNGERKGIKDNFPISNSAEPAFLFLQHFVKKLKKGGRAGVVIKNTFLSSDDARQLREWFLRECDLEMVLDLPPKVFSAGVKTVVLFFKKGESTKKIWCYKLNLDRNLGKTNPLNEKDLKEFLQLYKGKRDSENSWTVAIKDVDKKTFDLSIRNPNKKQEDSFEDPKVLLKSMEENNKEIGRMLGKIQKIV